MITELKGPVIVTGHPRSGTTAVAYPLFKKNPLFTNELCILDLANIVADDKRAAMMVNCVMSVYGSVINDDTRANLLLTLSALENFKHQVEFVYGFLRDNVNCTKRAVREASSTLLTGVDPEMFLLRDANHASRTEVLGDHEVEIHNVIWGDKSPWLVTNTAWKTIYEAWPDIKVIYMQRDARSVVASHLRLGWCTMADINNIFDKWLEVYHAVKSNLNRVMFVSQERLLNPDTSKSVVSSINRYLGYDAVAESDYDMFVYKHGVVELSDIDDSASSTNRRNKHCNYWKEFIDNSQVPNEVMAVLRELNYNI